MPPSPALAAIAARHGATPFQITLAWVLCNTTVVAIPKATTEARVNDNRRALDLVLTVEDLTAINADFPPPTRKTRLAMLRGAERRPNGEALEIFFNCEGFKSGRSVEN